RDVGAGGQAVAADGQRLAQAAGHEREHRPHPQRLLGDRVEVAAVAVAGVDLPAGADLAPCIYLVHHREDVYEDPYAFRPERFLGVKPGTYTWLPFGGGVRRCLGASFALFEMQVVLRTVLRSKRLRAIDPASERTARRAVTLVPGRGAEAVAA
ncbi:MAG TPA: cytochrome P450, partial [Solirubrobacteraceae bacterium]